MRKWLIASDIHGSAYYCRALLDAYQKEGADRLILLGDILYHGPRNDLPRDYAPKEVIAMLSEHKNEILAVRGNCDTEVDQMVLPFPILADYAVITAGDRLVYLTHGHVYNASHLPPLKQGDVLLHGHTHVSGITEQDGHPILNPGSVSIPKQDTKNGYILLTDNTFVFKTLEGDAFATFDA